MTFEQIFEGGGRVFLAEGNRQCTGFKADAYEPGLFQEEQRGCSRVNRQESRG